MKGVTHRSNTRAGKAPLPAHNRKPGVAAARDGTLAPAPALVGTHARYGIKRRRLASMVPRHMTNDTTT